MSDARVLKAGSSPSLAAGSMKHLDSSSTPTASWDEEQQTLLRHSRGISFEQQQSASREALIRVLLATAVACGWMVVSSMLILVNKYILRDLNFGYPMTVAGMGMSSSGILAYILCHVVGVVEAKAVISRQYWLTRILPIGFFMALTLCTGNLVYLYLSVSFIQMLKAFTPIMTMIALFIAKLETPTTKMIGSVVGIAIGTALSAYGEVHNSVVGLVCMITSEATEATRLVLTQLMLTGLQMGPIEGVMWMAPACWLWLMLGASLLEWPTMLGQGHHLIPLQHPWLFTLAAGMGFVVNVLAYATINMASSLTLKVLGCAKNALLIVAAMVLFAEQVTLLQGIGYIISTAAFGVYTHLKITHIANQATPTAKSAG